MSLSEFELIETVFAGRAASLNRTRSDVILGIGDDAAMMSVRPGYDLVAAADALVDGVHFPHDLSPWHIGYRTLAVNLSDIAAMGAEARWFTLSLTIPSADAAWLADFADGLFFLAAKYDVALIGGDTTRGPLTLSVQVLGEVPAGKALRRAGASEGDSICVTGIPGLAALGLQRWKRGERQGKAMERFLQPEPRLRLGSALRGVASAAIDISDGLWADLEHLLQASGVGARLDLALLPGPCDDAGLSRSDWQRLSFGGGDDYELCFTVPGSRLARARAAAAALDVEITVIGEIVAEPGIRVPGIAAELHEQLAGGYRHF